MAHDMNTAADVVQRQVDAYNARDLEGFAATYAESITIFRMPAVEPAVSGKAQLTEVYRERFRSDHLHAEILARIVLGDKVIDHERVIGIRDEPMEAVVVYEVRDGVIRNVWFFFPAQHRMEGPTLTPANTLRSVS
jgi:hypothetical protein